MRIRSIKPEFWRSDDITALSREDRLLFIGLWSYVDDNGVGVDDFRAIAADLFALEDDQKDIRDFVREGLATLSRGLLIDRYEVEGRRYIHITKWKKHQRVDRPNKERYPLPPPDYTPPTSGNRDSSRECRESVATVSPSGTEEQGNRGTGEQGRTTAARKLASAELALVPSPAAPLVPASITGRDATAAWHDAFTQHHDANPTKRQVSQAARESKALLDAGNPPDRVVYAARTAGARGFATVEREYRDLASRHTHPAPPTRNRPSTADDRVAAGLALAEKYAQEI
jgi:hypothetical protein